MALPAVPLPPDSAYVSAHGPHLMQDGKRVRLWGAIGGFPGNNRRDIDPVLKRLEAMGFNAIRYWGVDQLDDAYARGDGSFTDRYDYLLAQAGRRGMRIWMPSITDGVAKATDHSVLDDPATSGAWQTAIGEGVPLRNHLAVIWDPRLKVLAKRRIERVANHVNRHNGLRLADDPTIAIWELTNEQWWFGHMVSGEFQRLPELFQKSLYQQWTAFLTRKYQTEANLRAAWLALLPEESLAEGRILLLPLRSNVEVGTQQAALGVAQRAGVPPRYTVDDFATQRGRDVIEFLLELWIGAKREQHQLVKSLGKSMRLSPLVWDTGIGYEIQAQFMQQHADAISHCTYITGFHLDSTTRRFPWFSGLEEPPRIFWNVPWVEHNRHPSKPYLVYETQMEQPSKFRAEYPLRIAALAAIQDWDAVCWHYYGGVPDSTQPAPYSKALDYTQSHSTAHPQGYHYQFDEVQMSAMRAAAEVFKNGHASPVPSPTRFIFGQRSLTDPRSMEYGTSYGANGLRMAPTTYRYGVRLEIDTAREDDAIIGPSIVPRVYEPGPVKPTEQIEYDRQQGSLVIDTPGAVSFVGFLANRADPTGFAFRQGVRLESVTFQNPPNLQFPVTEQERYVAFTLATTDGKPFRETRRAVLSLVSTSFNRGFRLDPGKFVSEFRWQANPGAIVALGEAPVDVVRVGATVVAPALDGMNYRMLDWELRELSRGVVRGGRLSVPIDRPVWTVEFTRP